MPQNKNSEQIYNYLTPAILTRLARVNKALYASVQSPLYRHASIGSFEKLKLFVGTLNNVAMFDRWGEGAVSKNVVTLDISVDPNATEAAGGSRPTAVLLSRMIAAIGRYIYSIHFALIKSLFFLFNPVCLVFKSLPPAQQVI